MPPPFTYYSGIHQLLQNQRLEISLTSGEASVHSCRTGTPPRHRMLQGSTFQKPVVASISLLAMQSSAELRLRRLGRSR